MSTNLNKLGSGQTRWRVVAGIVMLSLSAALVTAQAQSPAPAQTSAPAANRLTPAEQRDGWSLLFNGTSLDGWRGYKRPDSTGTRWVAADGLLCVEPGTGQDTRGQFDIITTRMFEQFEIAWEWRVALAGNSGLKYFVLEDMPSAIGHEYQMIDDERHPDAKVGPKRQTSALYDVLPAANRPLRPAGQFNQSRVVVRGMTVEHWLNGTKVLQYDLNSPTLRGAIAESKFKDVARFGSRQNAHILLQDHGDNVCYRNIKIRPVSGK